MLCLLVLVLDCLVCNVKALTNVISYRFANRVQTFNDNVTQHNMYENTYCTIYNKSIHTYIFTRILVVTCNKEQTNK